MNHETIIDRFLRSNIQEKIQQLESVHQRLEACTNETLQHNTDKIIAEYQKKLQELKRDTEWEIQELAAQYELERNNCNSELTNLTNSLNNYRYALESADLSLELIVQCVRRSKQFGGLNQQDINYINGYIIDNQLFDPANSSHWVHLLEILQNYKESYNVQLLYQLSTRVPQFLDYLMVTDHNKIFYMQFYVYLAGCHDIVSGQAPRNYEKEWCDSYANNTHITLIRERLQKITARQRE